MSRVLFAVALVCAAPAAGQALYFSAIEDLPIAGGLVEEGAPIVFDDQNGRIVGAMARGPVAPAAVRSFYEQSLPALGWAPSPGAGDEGELVFLRGRERLALLVLPRGEGAELEVRLFTRPASMDAH